MKSPKIRATNYENHNLEIDDKINEWLSKLGEKKCQMVSKCHTIQMTNFDKGTSYPLYLVQKKQGLINVSFLGVYSSSQITSNKCYDLSDISN